MSAVIIAAVTARLAVLLACLMAGAGAAQGPATSSISFEVASVKRNLSGAPGARINVPPAGALSFINVPLRILIRDAYEVDPYTEQYRLISGPHARVIGSSVGRTAPDVPRFDVVAKPPDGTEPRDRRAMMRTLLEDRFKLRVHRELREMPAYALTVARPGRFGPSLAPSRFDCNAWLTQRRAGGTAADEPVNARGESWCLFPISGAGAGVQHTRNAGPMRLLLQRIQPYLDRPVVDETGVSTSVEWALTFGWGPNAPADVAALSTALEEQLGLRLDARRAPVEVLVVDSVELPPPD
jgi:uncharacterized protein (TIGR03435 family)